MLNLIKYLIFISKQAILASGVGLAKKYSAIPIILDIDGYAILARKGRKSKCIAKDKRY